MNRALAEAAVASGSDSVGAGENLLEIRNLVKRFPLPSGMKVHAVEDVSLSICRGETLALVGESGCGKTTLAQLAMRLLTPDSGQILLDGVDIAHLSRRALRPYRSALQMVFQDPYASLNPRATIGASIAEPLRVHKRGTRSEIQERVRDLLELVGLERDLVNRFPHQFSGGQRQRICIARALALNPRLLVADEAVSALDVSVQATVLNLMMDLQDELGIGLLFVSHDLAVVERLAHRVAVMYLGQVVELGSRRDIFEDPCHSYTRRLLSAVPVPDPSVRGKREMLSGEIPSPVWPKGEGPEVVDLREVSPGHWVAAEIEGA
ncbi:oligopeptide/dipeptide transporter [Antricoccus suffuscus]|uniref:Glutathione import ATP-binding protein GsiA n=1 Tax=Antricoccus suffuscus TaxID=1629062 RepID=A0A2T0ZYN6_9ACTN|nr:ATP-binding cassette domain-containing protein [Antricoccus suffuscus]PRZ41469.1 oligopeptide/dipeptide transporter [Antricoccus suffuscus]